MSEDYPYIVNAFQNVEVSEVCPSIYNLILTSRTDDASLYDEMGKFLAAKGVDYLSPTPQEYDIDDSSGSDSEETVAEWKAEINNSDVEKCYDSVTSIQEKVRRPYVNIIVETLAESDGFISTVEEVSRCGRLDESAIREIAKEYPYTFQLKDDVIELKPQLKLCEGHSCSQGCQNWEICCDIHICNEYIDDLCHRSTCVLGHRWDTGHNHSILKKMFLDILPSSVLQKFIKLNRNLPLRDPLINLCCNYNQDGCFSSTCPSLHICALFIYGIASGNQHCVDDCERNHDILSSTCQPLLKKHGIQVCGTTRDIVLAIMSMNPSFLKDEVRGIKRKLSSQSDMVNESSMTVWSHYLNGDVSISEICYQSVEGICPLEESGCQRLHSTMYFHWQVSEQENCWLNLRPAQVKYLEQAYCYPNKDSSVVLPSLDPASLGQNLRSLFIMMGRDTWSSEFSTMTLTNISTSRKLKIRRLGTERNNDMRLTYSWYFLDGSNKWVQYRKTDTPGDNDFKSDTISDFIEEAYLANPTSMLTITNSGITYLLDFQQMMEFNQATNTSRKITRRPQPCIMDVGNLPVLWRLMLPTERVQRITLCQSSLEYKKIITLLEKGREANRIISNLKRIERIQNPYLWIAYQNKVREMSVIYGNSADVNIQYLFHGTTPDAVKAICENNFDWRLYGTKNGNSRGNGSYFSSNPAVAAKYTRPDDSGFCSLFVAQVAVGTMTRGHRRVTIPPLNPVTNLPFESTGSNSVIVKYDKQEYYPEYIVTFKY